MILYRKFQGGGDEEAQYLMSESSAESTYVASPILPDIDLTYGTTQILRKEGELNKIKEQYGPVDTADPAIGCVAGICQDYSRQSGLDIKNFRKQNNTYGDAWELMDNAYGRFVDVSDKDYSKLKINDLVSLTRPVKVDDKAKNIPSKEQHTGRVSKIVDGIPYIKHYLSGSKKYYEEPADNIQAGAHYIISRAKRLDGFKSIIYKASDFQFDKGYKPNQIEEEFLDASLDKKNIQKVLN